MADFVKVAAAVPAVRVADTAANADSVVRLCRQMAAEQVSLAVFPEMCLTAYTCADLFHNNTLIQAARRSLADVAARTADLDLTFIVGLPLVDNGLMYNTAAVVHAGSVIAFVPKTYIPDYNEFYEKRWWIGAPPTMRTIDFDGRQVPFGTAVVFDVDGVKFGVEICEDLWTPVPPSVYTSMAGAEIVFNLSASDALIGKYDFVRNLVKNQSVRCVGAYVYASAGFGESTTDVVFDGITLAAACGRLVAEGNRWHGEEFFTPAVIDLEVIRRNRLQISSFADSIRNVDALNKYATVKIDSRPLPDVMPGYVDPEPFVPTHSHHIAQRCDEIINIQTTGLAQRLNATHTSNLVVGISGGLDSTLALLVAVRTFDRLGLDRKGIHAVTMPGFGTSGRTYKNAVGLIRALGVSFREISIVPAVTQHFKDIGHDISVKDVTYENSQARQRTMLLMDIANQVGGMVLGTGDLSELALGWATYNGDQMSMYGVNAGVPKTLVRYLVTRFANGEARLIPLTADSPIPAILFDIADTPISPELIPADDKGHITQKTEDLVGPYTLHDFFLYYMLRYGLGPKSIYRRACVAFDGKFDHATILHWLRTFTRRFFAQQFKRSCMPDGPKVGSVCLSPRGDWRMPSDASSALWLAEIDTICD